jgi:hypothetical protein
MLIINKIMEEKINLLKMSSGRIGGKGSVRRKKKVTKHRLKPAVIKTKNDIQLENNIIKINKKIQSIDSIEAYEDFVAYIEDNIFLYLSDICKGDFSNKDNFTIFIEDPHECFYEHFIFEEQTNSARIFFNENASDYKSFFNNEISAYLLEMFQEIDFTLDTKKYLEEDKAEEEVNSMSLQDCYKFFDLDFTSEITKDQLKKKYREKALLFHPDRYQDNKEFYEEQFKMLSKYYKFILKSLN